MTAEAAGTGVSEANPAQVFQDDPDFAEYVGELVREQAPRVFVIVHEHGHRDEAEVAAWGLGFEDHVEAIAVDGQCRFRMRSAARAALFLGVDEGATAHVFWLDR